MDKIGTLLCALAALLAGGCRGRHATGAQPSLRVEVIEAATDTVPNRMSFVSSVESNFDALIEPRVNGYLVNKYFSSGMPVRKGQLLFTIDPNLLSTTLLSAEASLESARAQEVSARNNYERAVPLARIDAISQTQLDQYTAEYVAAQAAVRSAKLFCGYCGALMFGESGVSHTGKMYTYYKCAAAKKKKTCDKKAVRKQWLEDLVVNETMRNMQLLKRYRNAAISSACIWRSHLRP